MVQLRKSGAYVVFIATERKKKKLGEHCFRRKKFSVHLLYLCQAVAEKLRADLGTATAEEIQKIYASVQG